MKKRKTDKRREEFQEYCKKLVSILVGKMGLGEYKITLEFVKKISDRKHTYEDGFSADVDADSRYLDAKIRISDKLYRQWLDRDYYWVAQTLVHELTHILTDPYSNFLWNLMAKGNKKQAMELLSDVNERQTERIASAIMNSLHWEDYDYVVVIQ